MKKLFTLLICIILLLTLFSGCKGGNLQKFTDYSFDYFDTATTIVGYEKSQKEFDKNCRNIKAQLNEYHKLYDIYKSYGEQNNLCTLNSQKNIIKVDSRITDLLLFSKDMYRKTDGYLNIAMGSVLSVWHTYRERGKENPQNAVLPPEEILEKAAEHTDIENLKTDTENQSVTLEDEAMSLDVGAVGKGYAVQKVCEWMKKNGISHYLLNVGGNVQTVGSKPDGTKWAVGIENPDRSDRENEYIKYLEIENKAVVTSGSYQRFFTVGSKNYHHIINPDTLFPSEYYLSVSVISDSSATADALSTALFSVSIEKGKEILKNFPDTEVMWVKNNGKICFTDGFSKYQKK